ncbi:MAG TPA: hypothetical protein VFH27_15895 [Longimicrobiaceae bacterium]|nr:hypothetical protein [Longimicrobiaceae bacterium]
MIAPPPSRIRHWLLPAATLVLAVLLFCAQQEPMGDPREHRYGVNWPGDMRLVLIEAAVEIAALLILLRPWSYVHGAGRATAAFVVFLPWMMFSVAVGMHGGPIISAHDVWLMAITVGLFVLAFVSSQARWRWRRRHRDRSAAAAAR